MPAPVRGIKYPFILVPKSSDLSNREAMRAAMQACRVAHGMGFTPVCPMLFFSMFLSEGELSLEIKKLSKKHMRRCDRIWLHFPTDDVEDLDTLAYTLLEANWRSPAGIPVYMLQMASNAPSGYLPIPVSRDEVDELLACNVSRGSANYGF